MTEAQAKAVIELVAVMVETIRDAGSQGVPSGILYAAVMSMMTLEQYQQIIALMKQSGKVRESGHILYIAQRSV